MQLGDIPLDLQLIVDASGAGAAPTPLQLKLVKIDIHGDGVTKSPLTAFKATTEDATYQWFLIDRSSAQDILVSESAIFTPVEPGFYRLHLTINGQEGRMAKDVSWANLGPGYIYGGSGDEHNNHLGTHGSTYRALYGNGGDDYLRAGSLKSSLYGGADDDVLVAGLNQTTMTGGYSYSVDPQTRERIYSPDNDMFLVYRGQTRFADKAHKITDFTPTHDKIGLGYFVSEVWYKQTEQGIYLLNSAAMDADYYVFIAFDNSIHPSRIESLIIDDANDLSAKHFDILGRQVMLREFTHDIRTKNDLHHWVVNSLDDDALVTLRDYEINSSVSFDLATDRADALANGRLIDLGNAKHVWFDVEDVDGDGDQDTILYKTADRSETYGVLDDYNGRAKNLFDRALDADFFVDNSITIIDLDTITSDML